MSKLNVSDFRFNESIDLAKRSKALIPKIKNWCSKVVIETEYGGIIGQMGYPTMNTIFCSQAHGGSAMNLEWIAYDFIIDNCQNCTFHKEIHNKNFGRLALEKYNANKIAIEAKRAKEQEIINELKVKIDIELKNKTNSRKISELSILKLLEKLNNSKAKRDVIANEINEASKLKPGYFNQLSVDFLTIFIGDKNLRNKIIETISNLSSYDSRNLSKFSISKILENIKQDNNTNSLISIISEYEFDSESKDNLIFDLVKNYSNDYDNFSHNIDYFENHSPNVIKYISKLFKEEKQRLSNHFNKLLLDKNTSLRANTCLILFKIFDEDENITIQFVDKLIKAYDIHDNDDRISADNTISITLKKIALKYPEVVFNSINKEFPKLGLGGKIEVIKFYKICIEDDEMNILFPNHILKIVEELISLIVNNDYEGETYDKPIKIIKKYSDKESKFIDEKFDVFIGLLIKSIDKQITFKWYKKDLDEDKITFNPLKNLDIYSIMNEELKISSDISDIKDILKNILKYNQEKNYQIIVDVISNLDVKKTNEENVKIHLIEVLRLGLHKKQLLINVLPHIYNWTLDFESVFTRVESLKFINKLIEKNSDLVPQTIYDLVEVFLKDNELIIKKHSIDIYKWIIINKKIQIKEEVIDYLIEQFSSNIISIHKGVSDLTYNLFEILTKEKANLLLVKIIQLLETHHNQKKRDNEFCGILFKQAMFISKKTNPNHLSKTENVLINKYLIYYCDSEDFYSNKNFIKILTNLKTENSNYNSVWLKIVLKFLYKYKPNNFENYSFGSYRKSFYEEMFTLEQKDILTEIDYIKDNIKKAIVVNYELYQYDIIFTLNIFSFFNLHEHVVDITDCFIQKIDRVPINNYFFEIVEDFKYLSDLQIKCKTRNLSDSFVNKI